MALCALNPKLKDFLSIAEATKASSDYGSRNRVYYSITRRLSDN